MENLHMQVKLSKKALVYLGGDGKGVGFRGVMEIGKEKIVQKKWRRRSPRSLRRNSSVDTGGKFEETVRKKKGRKSKKTSIP